MKLDRDLKHDRLLPPAPAVTASADDVTHRILDPPALDVAAALLETDVEPAVFVEAHVVFLVGVRTVWMDVFRRGRGNGMARPKDNILPWMGVLLLYDECSVQQ